MELNEDFTILNALNPGQNNTKYVATKHINYK
ncbi:unnamed protein product [Spodoptera exigua]|nr:unnamed protein product [Spodoptera exigua]